MDENTRKNYRSCLKIIGETFGERDPETIAATEIAAWIAGLAETKKAGTLGQYRIVEAIEDTCPLDDRTPERRVFQEVTDATLYQGMRRACVAAIPHYHPHDLRDRRITIWHHSGVVARVLAERAGHEKPSMSLDVYAGTMPVAEATERQLRALVEG